MPATGTASVLETDAMTGGSSAVAVVAGRGWGGRHGNRNDKTIAASRGSDVVGGTGKQSTDQRPDVTGLADLVGQHRGCERGEIGRRNIVERPAGPAGVVVNENYISINADHLTGPKTRHPDIKSFKRSQADRIIPVGRKGGEHLVQHALEQRLDRIGLRAIAFVLIPASRVFADVAVDAEFNSLEAAEPNTSDELAPSCSNSIVIACGAVSVGGPELATLATK